MSSASQNPFLDPDVHEPLPPTPPIPPVPPRSTARPSSPLIQGLPVPEVYQNLLEDPANIISLAQSATSSSPVLEVQALKDDAKSTITPFMTGANNEEVAQIRLGASMKLGRSDESSLSGSTTLVGYTACLTPRDSRGYDIKKPFVQTSNGTYPLRSTRNANYISAPRKLQHETTSSRRPKEYQDRDSMARTLAPTRNKKPACFTIRGMPKEAHVSPSKSFAISGRPGTSYKKEKARETAYLQNQLLQAERQRTAASLYEVPKLYPSPRRRPECVIIRNDGDSGEMYGLQGVMRSSWFWVFFFLIQIGIISTGAAIGVLLREKGVEQSVAVGSEMLFWLICSIAASIIGIIGTICLCGSRRTILADSMKTAGLDEMGLMPKHLRSESAVARGIRGREEKDRRLIPRLARSSKVKREKTARNVSLSRINTLDPMWQALYTTPEELRAEIGRELNRHEEPVEMETGARKYVKKKGSIGVESMLSGGSDLRMFNESDIGMQTLSLMPVQSSAAEDIKSNSSFHYTRHNIDSRFPFSKLHSPPYQKPVKNSYKIGKLRTPDAFLYQEKDQSRLDEELSPLSSSSPHSLYNHTPKTSKSTSGRREISLKYHPLSNLDLAPNLNNGTTSLSTFSPLENLARDLNTPELRSLDAQDRQEYIVSRRSVNEERGRKVRQSLERVPLAKNIGITVSSCGTDMRSIGHERIEENIPESVDKKRAVRPIVQEIVRGMETRSLSLTGEREGTARSVKSVGSGNSKASSDPDSRGSKEKKLVNKRLGTR